MKSMTYLAMTMFTLGLVSSPLARGGSEPTVECNLKTLETFCESLKAKEKTQLRSSIPHKFSNGESMPSADSIHGASIEMHENGETPNIPWGKMQRLQKLYKVTQAYAQEAIRRGRPLSELSSEEKNIIERLKTMKLGDLHTAQDREMCNSGYRFGYNPHSHSLIMCPEMAGYPASGIVWAMAAFMGRGIGTCVTGGLKYVDAKKNVVFDLIPEEKYPLNSLRSCLIKGGFPDAKKNIDFEKPELKAIMGNEITRSHKNKSAALPMNTGELAAALKDEKNIAWAKKTVGDLRECLPEQTNSRVDSGIQDSFGSEVAARYLEDHPLNAVTPEDALQPLAPMVDYICRTPKADELTRKFHVPIETRLNSAIFANARLRKVMNCSPKTPAKQICSIGDSEQPNVNVGPATAIPSRTDR